MGIIIAVAPAVAWRIAVAPSASTTRVGWLLRRALALIIGAVRGIIATRAVLMINDKPTRRLGGAAGTRPTRLSKSQLVNFLSKTVLPELVIYHEVRDFRPSLRDKKFLLVTNHEPPKSP